MKLTVNVDDRMLNDVQARLGEFHNKAPNAISNALNRAASNINTNIKREVRKDYNIKAGDVTPTLKVAKATRNVLRAAVQSRGELIPLDKFKVSPKTINPVRKAPIKVGVKKGSLKKVIGAFVADISGTKVFQRKTSSRLPIKRLFGPSVPQMLGNEELRAEIEKQGQATFDTRLDHEINRILERGRGK